MSTIKFNVAQLLREMIGARRDYEFSEPALPLDDDLTLRDISGQVRFIRTATGVFAQVRAEGFVTLTCVRSLELFNEQLVIEFSDLFHSQIDVVSGAPLPTPAEDDPFMLTDLHMADIGDAMREYALLAIPLNPVSPAYRNTTISYSVQSDGLEEEPTVAETDGEADIEALRAWAERQNRRNRT